MRKDRKNDWGVDPIEVVVIVVVIILLVIFGLFTFYVALHKIINSVSTLPIWR